MNDALPIYPQNLGDTKSWRTIDAANQYSRFDQLLTEAENQSLFDALPDSPDASQTHAFKKRGETMAERLWLLGYLIASNKDAARATFSDNRELFLTAVEAFQRESKLTPDRWPGIQTWNALSNLVSFESDDLDEAWLSSPEDFPAVLRAVQCRLFVLGMTQQRPGSDFKQIKPGAFRKFKLLALALGAIKMSKGKILPFLNSPAINEETLVLLLDQDRLIEAVARSNKRSSGKLYFRYIPVFKNWSHKARIRAFLVRLIQVEFWLLGYDIDLSAPLNYPIIGFDEGKKIKRSRSLTKCLADFAVLAGKSKKTWERELTPDLFIALHRAAAQEDDPELYEKIESRVKSQEQIESALNQGRKLHMRLWDGIKRVLRWIGRLFRKAVKSILDLGRSIARFFYNKVQQAFDIVKNAVGVIVRAIGTLDGTQIRDEDNFISILFDGDVVVGTSGLSHPNESLRLATRLRLDAERFCLAAQICALILSALIKSAFARWASLAKVLFSNLKMCLSIIRKVYTLEKEMAMLSAD